MTQYIDKAAVVAEIEKRANEYPCDNSEQDIGYHCALYEMEDFINSLKVKEVNLEKEIDTLWCSLFTDNTMKRDPTNPHTFIPDPTYTKDGAKIAYRIEIDWKVDEIDADFLRKTARHFFELGLKAQKGE